MRSLWAHPTMALPPTAQQSCSSIGGEMHSTNFMCLAWYWPMIRAHTSSPTAQQQYKVDNRTRVDRKLPRATPPPRPLHTAFAPRLFVVHRADPFAKTVPDHVDSVLSYGVEDATVCCFDKRGTYLAVGYATGVVVIWDFVTRQV